MSEKPPLARAVPGKMIGRQTPQGKESFRIVGPDDKPLMTRDQKPVDNGGIVGKNLANLRAEEINDYYDKLRKEQED